MSCVREHLARLQPGNQVVTSSATSLPNKSLGFICVPLRMLTGNTGPRPSPINHTDARMSRSARSHNSAAACTFTSARTGARCTDVSTNALMAHLLSAPPRPQSSRQPRAYGPAPHAQLAIGTNSEQEAVTARRNLRPHLADRPTLRAIVPQFAQPLRICS